MILCIAGDPGGSRCVSPVALALLRMGEHVVVADHGFLSKEWPAEHAECVQSLEVVTEALPRCKALIFGSSTHDTCPLALARQAKYLGIPVIHVLDNWSFYMGRLCMDGQQAMIPDLYAVMDVQASNDAVADGVPAECIKITGHPGMSDAATAMEMLLTQDVNKLKNIYGIPLEKLSIAFVSEPFLQVMGADTSATGHVGFTEEEILTAFSEALQPYAKDVFVSLLPHPKHDVSQVEASWQRVRGALDGQVLVLPEGRRILGMVSGVAGMISILLYEAWLVGMPVLSVQPGCKINSMRRFSVLDGVTFADSWNIIAPQVSHWLGAARATNKRAPKQDLQLHKNAPGNIAALVLQMCERNV